MRPRWRKVISDLLDNKARTLLVVLSIAVGVFAIGVLAGTYVIISQDLGVTYAANNPSNMEIRLDDFDEDLLHTVQEFEGVKDAEARRVFPTLIRPPGESKWTSVDVVALDSFEDNEVNLLRPVSGASAPTEDQILLEKDVLDEFQTAPGETIEVRLGDETIKEVEVAGVVQDASTGAIDFLSPPLAYIQTDSLSFYNEPDEYNRIFATVDVAGQDDEETIRGVLANLTEKIEKNDYTVSRSFISKTHEHPLESTINAVLGILLALGVLI
ncbi:MAG: ABC transporter permease, partial [Anaerolineales bacterium]